MIGHAESLLAALRRPQPELLDPGTQVTAVLGGRIWHGVVMPYDQRHSHGTFSVRFDDWVWRTMTAADVTVVSQPRDPR